MKLIDRDLEQMEAYYNKTLPENEHQVFENRLASDKEFEQAILEYQKISKTLDSIKRNKRLAFLKEVDSQMPPIPQTPVINIKRILAIAATVLIGALVLRLYKSQSGLKTYFKPYSSHASTKGVEVEDKQTLAYRAYDNGDYATAAPLFKSAFAERPDTMLLFFESVSQVGCGESENAIINLEQLIGSEIAPQEILPYYLGLAYAGNNQFEKAANELKKAINTKGEHQQAAKDALIFVQSKMKK